MNLSPERPMMTAEQASALLGISRATLYRMKDRGELTFYKFGRSIRFHPDDIDALRGQVRP